jgi:hypothetical protein
MPEKETLERARRARRQGKSPKTQAGEFIREEIHHVREGRHGARSTKQAIAIGLSKARRAGIRLGRPPASSSAATRRSAASATRSGRRGTKPARSRSRGSLRALKREGRGSVSRTALAAHAHQVARRRGPAARRASARKAVATKGPAVRKAAARKAARTRRAA